MPLDEPRWWYGEAGKSSTVRWLLTPASRIYGSYAVRRFTSKVPYRSALPVICAGNFTAGGTGKTPLCLRLAAELQAMGERPAFLTRGYGGTLRGPQWLSDSRHDPRETGDEPLLLASVAPVMISRDRADGARAIEQSPQPPSVIVMDDGLQNPSLQKDLVIAVVDGRRGVGNGGVIPAGPLRAPLGFQLELTNCIVVNGGTDDGGAAAGTASWLRRLFPGPVLDAHVAPGAGNKWLKGARVAAYCGIANPGRFFELLERLGAELAVRRVFADHHAFTEREAAELMAAAKQTGATLVTTAKDFVRLGTTSGERARLRELTRPVPVELSFDPANGERLRAILAAALKTRRERQG